jgi:hypothetical protein
MQPFGCMSIRKSLHRASVSAFTPFAPLRYNGLLVIAQESAREFRTNYV